MRYIEQYCNQDWYYSVYKAEDKDDYILQAVVPGVGMYTISLFLRKREVKLLKISESNFTKFVNRFIKKRNSLFFKHRIIKGEIVTIDLKTIEYKK